jgi:hypothetical protein
LPYSISFNSTTFSTELAGVNGKGPWYEQLKEQSQVGKTIMHVYGWDKAPAHPNATEHHIADIELITDLIFSDWGDSRLFFQHRRAHRDYRKWGEWKDDLEED